MKIALVSLAASATALGVFAGTASAAPEGASRANKACLVRIVSETQCINGHRVVCQFRVSANCQRVPIRCIRPAFPVPCVARR